MPTPLRRTVPFLVTLALAAQGIAHAQRPPVGAARTVLVLDSIDLAGIGTLSELLQARVPGLLVSARSGSAGAGATVVARGRRTVLGESEPLLVIDGRRAIGAQRSMELDTTASVSRLDDVVLEHVERVEVLRGPAASARYGTGAANGAIVVTTRAGRAGHGQRTAYARTAAARDVADYPTLYVGVARAAGYPAPCTLALQQRRDCELARLDAHPYVVPTRTGHAAAIGATAGGGGSRMQYWLGGDARRAQGVLPGNAELRAALRANVDWQPGPDMRLAIRAAGTRRDVEVPRGDQRGLLQLDALGRQPLEFGAGTAPQEAWRGDASVRGEWEPRTWLRLRADAGLSDVARTEHTAFAFNDSIFGRTPSRDWLSTRDGSGHEWVASGALAAELAYRVGSIRAVTTVGVERLGARLTRERAEETSSSDDGPAGRSWMRQWERSDLWSPHLAQQVAVGERLTIDASLRSDRGLGLQFTRRSVSELSASASAAWSVWRDSAGGDLRLRAAHGTSVAPLGLAALGQVSVYCYYDCDKVPSTRHGAERTREWEAGLDASLAGRHTLRITAFDQRSTNVVLPVAAPPSSGAPGVVPAFLALKNVGLEAEASASVFERPSAALTIAGRAAVLRNRVDASFASQLGNTQAIVDGQPLNGFYDAPVLVVDVDVDGVVESGEVTWSRWPAQGTPSLIPSTPTRLAALDLRLRLGRSLRIGGVVEHRGGHAAYGARPDLLLFADRARFDATAPLLEQAFAFDFGARSAGLFDRADITRLREVVVSYALGGAGRATTLSVAGRNLATWSGFHGPDAEVVTQPTSNGSSAYHRQPLPATVAVRLETRF